MWPVYAYLLGEVRRLRGETGEAKQIYSELAAWAVSDPYHDGWGGSSLAAVALCRCLQIITDDPHPDRSEAARLMGIYEQLKDTRLTRRMFQVPVLTTLPQLEEDIARNLALLAWSSGRKDEALRLFLEYLTVARSAELNPTETQMMKELLASGLASRDHLTLFRGKRLLTLGNYSEASKFLAEARSSPDADVRSEAGLHLAHLRRIQGASRELVAGLYGSVLQETTNPEVAETALYERALVLDREGRGRDVPQFLKDLNQLVDSYPLGRHAGEALYALGQYYKYAGDVDKALQYFERVTTFKGPTDSKGLATLFAALALYTRGQPQDIARASELLQQLSEITPPTDLRPAALFWLGRITAETGEQERSQEYFQQIIAETPYDYYAVRSHLHLSLGNGASKELWPDPKTAGKLRNAYQSSKLDFSLSRKSPYHQRLAGALEAGLYSSAVAAESGLRKIYPSRRLEDLSLKELEDTGLTAHLVLLLALRQDASAAKDALPDPENQLQIAGAVAHGAGDWPLAMSLVVASGEPYEQRAAAQRDQRYLATAYPEVYGRAFRKAGAAWDVPPELLYSTAREESLFYPAALSSMGALGLFQFLPPTFKLLDERWNLLKSSGTDSGVSFLLNPDLNIDLGARWLKGTLVAAGKGDRRIPLAVMAHNAGSGAVREWVAYWTHVGRADDIEFAVENVRFRETRVFIRRVLTDMEIVDAAGFLKTDQ